MNIPKVSIIVPVYNVERYIGKCIKSLFDQTLDDIEYVFVDDCSSDDSLRILNNVLEKYPIIRKHTKIIHNTYNVGVAATRNIGLDYASGEYIGWVDADDWVDNNMFEQMYNTAKDTDSELLWTDFWLSSQNHDTYCSQTSAENPKDLFMSILLEKMKAPLWNKLIKRQVIQDYYIRCLDGNNMSEDRNICMKVLGVISKVKHIPNAFYHYTQYNNNSLMKNVSIETGKFYIQNSIDAVDFLCNNAIWMDAKLRIQAQLIAKKNYLLSSDYKELIKWHNVFPESNYKVFNCSELKFRHKLLACLEITHQFNVIRFLMFLKRLLHSNS